MKMIISPKEAYDIFVKQLESNETVKVMAETSDSYIFSTTEKCDGYKKVSKSDGAVGFMFYNEYFYELENGNVKKIKLPI
jgi:hypothetical protein